MVIHPHFALAQKGASHRRRRQWGAELVEAIMYLIPFLAVLFLIIDMSFRAFDQGMLAHATRTAVRQGSLYWVDPANYGPTLPRSNPRIKESMILSPINYYNNSILINPGSSPLTSTVTVANGTTLPWQGVSPNRIWYTDPNNSNLNVMDASVKVDVVYDHQSLLLGWWLGISGSDLRIRTSSELPTEIKY